MDSTPGVGHQPKVVFCVCVCVCFRVYSWVKICLQDECSCVPALLQLIPDDRKQPLLVHIEACILVDSKQCRGHLLTSQFTRNATTH